MFLGLLKRLFGPKLFGPRMLADPYPYYARLRSADPVHWSEQLGGWVLTRYADVTTLLLSSNVSADRANKAPQRTGPEFQALNEVRTQSMLNADPPRHTRLRLLVNKAFTPKTVEELAPFIRTFVDKVLDTALARGRMDVMAELAFPLPATVIAEMLGVPPEDRDRFKHWSDDTTAVANPPSTLSPEDVRRSVEGMRALQAYFRDVIARRRAEQRDDLLSALVKAQDEGDRLSDEELLANSVLLLN